MVPDRARGQFDPVAHDVVLIGQDVERVLSFQRLQPALGHGERVVREVDAARVLVQFEHRIVDDPAEIEAVLGDQVEVLADLGARGGSERREVSGHAGHEEHGIAVVQTERRLQRRRALVADVLGDGASALAVAEEDVAQSRLALALRPGVHAVAERAAAAARRRNGVDADLVVLFDHPGEHLEARTGECVRDVRHLDRVA